MHLYIRDLISEHEMWLTTRQDIYGTTSLYSLIFLLQVCFTSSKISDNRILVKISTMHGFHVLRLFLGMAFLFGVTLAQAKLKISV